MSVDVPIVNLTRRRRATKITKRDRRADGQTDPNKTESNAVPKVPTKNPPRKKPKGDEKEADEVQTSNADTRRKKRINYLQDTQQT